MSKKYQPLSTEGLAKTGGIVGFILWIVGIVWHGFMGQPSMMGLLYNLPYMQPMMTGGLLVGLVAGGFVLGWLIAAIYNWSIGTR